MRGIMRLPLFALLMSLGTIALEASVPFYTEPVPFNFHLDAGFREDNLKFRVGPRTTKFEEVRHLDSHRAHKTHSKVKWRNLKIAQIEGSFDYTTHNDYYIRANADYGRVLDGFGRVTNFFARRHHHFDEGSDYGSFGDDSSYNDSGSGSGSSYSRERREYSEQTSRSENGYVADLVGGVGWKVVGLDGRSWIAGLGGYSYHRQSYEMTHFEQKFDLIDLVNVGKIPGLKGTYVTCWTGPWLGVDYLSKIEYDVTLYGSLEWHFAKFRADGRWTYTEAYNGHFRQNSQGYGAVARMGLDWTPCDNWAFGICGDYQIWSTKNKGRNRATVVNNLPMGDEIDLTFPVVERASLRRVRWNSYSINGLVTYRF